MVKQNAHDRNTKRNEPKPPNVKMQNGIGYISNSGNKKQDKNNIQTKEEGFVQFLRGRLWKSLSRCPRVLHACIILYDLANRLREEIKKHEREKNLYNI